MNYDESKAKRPKVKKPEPAEPIKLVDDSPSWSVFLALVAIVAIGVMLAMYIKRPSVSVPATPTVIEAPKDTAKPKADESAQDVFNRGFNR